MKTLHLAAGLALLAAPPLPAQPQFEVATVKLSTPPAGDRIMINLGNILRERLTLTNATVADCVKFAYGLAADAQLAGPEWIFTGAVRLDVVAQAPADTPREQMLLMLRNLLADRIKLVTHREPREMSYLAMVPAKGGPKLEAADPPAGPVNAPSIAGRIDSPRMPMATLARLLSRFERQTVLDMTGLNGFYKVKLEWTVENLGRGAKDDAAPPPDGPSLYTAIQKQLGLRLDARKGPVEVLVVDSASRVPVEN
ncbi:MAG: TIGR03435 family protein [Acidobacteria bacterium]|nr:TIGR03435 family protein [Acidobacteriota bacterium]